MAVFRTGKTPGEPGGRDTHGTHGHTDHTNEPHISHPDPPTHDPEDDPRGRADRPTADSRTGIKRYYNCMTAFHGSARAYPDRRPMMSGLLASR